MTGIGQLLVGLTGLVIALVTGDGAGRMVIPFVVTFAVIAGVSVYASRWMRDAEPGAAASGVRIEETRLTVRRSLVGLVIALVVVIAAGVIGAGLAAVLGGVVAGAGAVDLANQAWARRRERETGLALYRELGSSPFSSGRRPLYTRPTRDITLAT